MQVVATYEARLVRYASDLVGAASARDVVQDTFMRLCDQERADVEPKLAAWLFTVCRNRGLELRRKVRPLMPLVEPEALPDLDATAADGELVRRETVSRVRCALTRLPERERELVRLKFDCELSYKEIAEITGLSVSNVGFILHTAVQRAREALAAADAPVPDAVKLGGVR